MGKEQVSHAPLNFLSGCGNGEFRSFKGQSGHGTVGIRANRYRCQHRAGGKSLPHPDPGLKTSHMRPFEPVAGKDFPPVAMTIAAVRKGGAVVAGDLPAGVREPGHLGNSESFF